MIYMHEIQEMSLVLISLYIVGSIGATGMCHFFKKAEKQWKWLKICLNPLAPTGAYAQVPNVNGLSD